VTRPIDCLLAAWKLFLRDPAALSAFDGSAAGARQSFRAALVALPIYWLLIHIGPDAIASRRGPLETLFVHAVFYALIWAVWPTVMLRLSRMVDRRERYCLYLAAYNWSMVVQAALWLVAAGVVLTFGLSGSAARIVTVAAIAVVVLYHLHILRSALDLRTLPALALAGFKLVLYQILLGTHHAALLQGSGS